MNPSIAEFLGIPKEVGDLIVWLICAAIFIRIVFHPKWDRRGPRE